MANNGLPPECLCATFRQSVTTNILQDICCCWLCLLNFTKPKATQLPHVVVEGKISINFFFLLFFFSDLCFLQFLFACLEMPGWLAGRQAGRLHGWLVDSLCERQPLRSLGTARYNSHNSQPSSQQRQTAKTCNWRLIV